MYVLFTMVFLFGVSGRKSYEISSKFPAFSGVEIGKHSNQQRVIRLIERQSLKKSAVQVVKHVSS
jgi:hypothetical protein